MSKSLGFGGRLMSIVALRFLFTLVQIITTDTKLDNLLFNNIQIY